MNNSKLLNEVKLSYQQKRLKAEQDCNELIEKLCEDENFHQLYTNYTSSQLKLLRAKFEKDKMDLQKDINSLQNKLSTMLSQKNLNLSSLSPNYECKLCNDTGIVAGKLCSCIKKEMSIKKNAMLNSMSNFKQFKDCNLNIMTENDKKVYELLNKWCNNYPNINKININLTGGSGTGKTFLLECVTSALIGKGYSVCFKTAFEFNELARLYHMGKSFNYSNLLDADVLVIDDLGTEPIINNVTKDYLYNLINTRQVHNKPTLISTNLNLDNLLDRYDERIFSRLVNKALAINITLNGSDKRLN